MMSLLPHLHCWPNHIKVNLETPPLLPWQNIVNTHMHNQLEVTSISLIIRARDGHISNFIIFLVPIMVKIVCHFIQDCLFRSLIHFITPISHYWDLTHDIYFRTTIMSCLRIIFNMFSISVLLLNTNFFMILTTSVMSNNEFTPYSHIINLLNHLKFSKPAI